MLECGDHPGNLTASALAGEITSNRVLSHAPLWMDLTKGCEGLSMGAGCLNTGHQGAGVKGTGQGLEEPTGHQAESTDRKYWWNTMWAVGWSDLPCALLCCNTQQGLQPDTYNVQDVNSMLCVCNFWNYGIWWFPFLVGCEDQVFPVIRGWGWCFRDAKLSNHCCRSLQHVTLTHLHRHGCVWFHSARKHCHCQNNRSMYVVMSLS